jgi:hypothetical protein
VLIIIAILVPLESSLCITLFSLSIPSSPWFLSNSLPILIPKNPLSPASASLLQHRNNLQHLLKLRRPLRTTAKPVEMINQVLSVHLTSMRKQVISDQCQEFSTFWLLWRGRCTCARRVRRGRCRGRSRRARNALTSREIGQDRCARRTTSRATSSSA